MESYDGSLQHQNQRWKQMRAVFEEASVSQNTTDTDHTVKGVQDPALTETLLRQNHELKQELEREQQRHQASQEELLAQIQKLKEEVERDPGEILAFKARHQAQCEHWMEQMKNKHEKELEAKDKVILSLENKAANAFHEQVEEARKAVEENGRDLMEAHIVLQEMLGTALRNQVSALQQELQQEKESLDSQVAQLQSRLSEKDQAIVTAQRQVEQLQTLTQTLSTTVSALTSALDRRKCLTSEAERKLQEKERETHELKTEVSGLRSALDQQEQATAEAQTSQTGLLQQVKELKQELEGEREQIRAFKARHQAQCEYWMEQVQKDHRKKLEAKDTEIEDLKRQKAAAFTAQVKDARKAAREEIQSLKESRGKLKQMVINRDKRAQHLLDSITQRSAQVQSLKDELTALNQAQQTKKEETEALWTEVSKLLRNNTTTQTPACNKELLEILKEKLQLEEKRRRRSWWCF
uniref:Uncharacterized protein n=1 Tax=Knipowitschia caucasica TaxID=637954 RepID=A0AAV2JK85_KNICA